MQRHAGYLIEDGPEGRTLVVSGDWSSSMAKWLSKGKVDGLTLNYALGFREHDLDFIGEWPVRRLNVLARTIKDLSPIYRLSNTLRQLRFQVDERARLDLNRMPGLSTVGGPWMQLEASVHGAQNLVDLFALGYDAEDLTPLTSLSLLQRLRFKDRPAIRSLSGVGQLRNLQHLGIFGASRLDDVSGLRIGPTSTTPRLETLQLESCPHVSRLDDLGDQTALTTLGVADCGEIESLRPVSAMKNLRSLHAWESTNIVDNDLSPLLGLPELREIRMRARHTYRPPLPTVRERLGILE